MLLLSLLGAISWLCIYLLPSRPWGTKEQIDANNGPDTDLSEVTILIPARNEAAHINDTLDALKHQGNGLSIVVIDDHSSDSTATVARRSGLSNLTVIDGSKPPPGWSGKLWALEQGLQHTCTDYILLLDADITLAPGLIATLIAKIQRGQLQMLSLMAQLKMQTSWERLLIPAFIFFFKLLYPFSLVNKGGSSVAAAAGGVVLVKRTALQQINAFASIKDALIDDCALAKKMKGNGYPIWIGLTHSAISTRHHDRLETIWRMVTRTAYNQLHYSLLLLLLCTAMMSISFIVPLLAVVSDNSLTAMIGIITLSLMMRVYISTLSYYKLPLLSCIGLPFAGILFLLMTWHAALQHYLGDGASWKGRQYSR